MCVLMLGQGEMAVNTVFSGTLLGEKDTDETITNQDVLIPFVLFSIATSPSIEPNGYDKMKKNATLLQI